MTSSEGIYEHVLSKVRTTNLVEEDPTIVVETTQVDDRVNPTEPSASEHKVKSAEVTLDNLFRNPESHPLLLDLALLAKYGSDWLGWELETVLMRVQQDFRTPTVAEINVEKVQACKALHLVDTFWERWEVFLHCCAAFNGTFADFHSMQIPEVAECLVAVDVANRIRDDMQWSGEVKTYLKAVHVYRGEIFPLPPLDFVYIDVAELPVDASSVRSRWPLVKSSGQVPRGHSSEDVQLRKMLASWQYLELHRRRLETQLQVLRHV
jgi:hypothetical protein